MKFYLAPLEGITTYIYRNAYHHTFLPMDKYFTPFLAPRQKRSFSSRERNDILPEHNQGLFVVPQLLTNKAKDFIQAARVLAEYGYEEVNLNLGCPSGTVTAKGKGAGFLARPAELDQFLEEIFSSLTQRISIKARIGMEDPQEFGALLKIFNQYPLEELIIHPRVREDFYKNPPNLQVFGEALRESAHPACYNGNLFSRQDFENLQQRFQGITAVMLGRGAIANPWLHLECIGLPSGWAGQDGEPGQGAAKEKKRQFQEFHALVCQGYQEILSGERDVLYKMKEFWSYMAQSFSNYGPYVKQIKKANSLQGYGRAVDALFGEQEVINHGRFSF